MNGKLDKATFNSPLGYIPVFFGGGFFPDSDLGTALAIQPDGKIVVGGYTDVPLGGSSFILARFNSDGTIDSAFGSAGATITNFGQESNNRCHALAMQKDGRIILAGFTNINGPQDFAIARFLSDGTPDLSFGNQGLAITNFGGIFWLSQANGVVVQQDGKIVAAGHVYAGGASVPAFAVARYKVDGTLDPYFGKGGLIVTEFVPGHGADGTAIVLQPSGRIVVAGSARFGTYSKMVLAGYSAIDGSLDPTFGNKGKVAILIGHSSDAFAIATSKTGALAVAGSALFGADSMMAVARCHPDGSLDKNFGTGGCAIRRFAGYPSRANAVFLSPIGEVLAAGQANLSSGIYYFQALAAFKSDGSSVNNFGDNGWGPGITKLGAYGPAKGLVVKGGRAITVGWDSPALGLAELTIARYT